MEVSVKAHVRVLTILIAVLLSVSGAGTISRQPDSGLPLSTPVFHHVHQNSTDPGAAIVAFQKIFPSVTRVTVGAFDAAQTANGAFILFTKVAAPPPTQPQSAFLRHVFSVGDVRELVRHLHSIGSEVRPLYT